MYALSLQGLPHGELLPAGLALELLLPVGRPVQRVQVLGQDLLAGEAGLALGTRVVLATATAACGVTGRKGEELLRLPRILKPHQLCFLVSEMNTHTISMNRNSVAREK